MPKKPQKEAAKENNGMAIKQNDAKMEGKDYKHGNFYAGECSYVSREKTKNCEDEQEKI